MKEAIIWQKVTIMIWLPVTTQKTKDPVFCRSLFVLFLLVIVLSVFCCFFVVVVVVVDVVLFHFFYYFLFTGSHYGFGICKVFLMQHITT